jgi:hypothetical protein
MSSFSVINFGNKLPSINFEGHQNDGNCSHILWHSQAVVSIRTARTAGMIEREKNGNVGMYPRDWAYLFPRASCPSSVDIGQGLLQEAKSVRDFQASENQTKKNSSLACPRVVEPDSKVCQNRKADATLQRNQTKKCWSGVYLRSLIVISLHPLYFSTFRQLSGA